MEIDAMDRIAFIYGATFIYWSSIIVTLGALTAVFVFLSLYTKKYGVYGKPVPQWVLSQLPRQPKLLQHKIRLPLNRQFL